MTPAEKIEYAYVITFSVNSSNGTRYASDVSTVWVPVNWNRDAVNRAAIEQAATKLNVSLSRASIVTFDLHRNV